MDEADAITAIRVTAMVDTYEKIAAELVETADGLRVAVQLHKLIEKRGKRGKTRGALAQLGEHLEVVLFLGRYRVVYSHPGERHHRITVTEASSHDEARETVDTVADLEGEESVEFHEVTLVQPPRLKREEV